MFIVAYVLGAQWSYQQHEVAHHNPGGIGVCESAMWCDEYAPRALCAQWRDEPDGTVHELDHAVVAGTYHH